MQQLGQNSNKPFSSSGKHQISSSVSNFDAKKVADTTSASTSQHAAATESSVAKPSDASSKEQSAAA
jgi:hypothetical protein